MAFTPEQRAAAEALVTGILIYGYNWVMRTPESTSQIAKKALIAQGLIYGYHKFK